MTLTEASTGFPAISLTAPTPPRSSATLGVDSNSPSSKSNATYRLLYRGALSLPDSHLLLGGLTFAARLESPSKHNTFSLLENPLALALESMRGRPSLRLMGVVNLADIWMDESGGVELDIHRNAILSRIYFENMFCLTPFPGPPMHTAIKSKIGIKVALGDSGGPETTEVLIYGTFNPSQPGPNSAKVIQLMVGRILTHPPVQKTLRLPRPDDPIPRKPPIFGRDFKRVISRAAMGPKDLKRGASDTIPATGVNATKRPKLVRGGSGSVAGLGSGVRLGAKDGCELFKVPELPRQKGKGKESERGDVFGDVTELLRSDGFKGKRKDDDTPGTNIDTAAIEKVNKTLLKKATIEYLAKTKDPTTQNIVLDKQHPDFKEFYGVLYRGVGFALRSKMKTETVDPHLVDKFLRIHVQMYLSDPGDAEI